MLIFQVKLSISTVHCCQ